MTIPRDTHLLYAGPPWQPVMHLDWTISSHHCSSAAEIFHFRLISIHSNARNSIRRNFLSLVFIIKSIKLHRIHFIVLYCCFLHISLKSPLRT